jgi:hypothetical protein
MSAISTPRRKVSFPPLQGKVPNEIHAILIETLKEHAPSYATVKNWVAQFKHHFSNCNAPRPGRHKTFNMYTTFSFVPAVCNPVSERILSLNI